MKMLLKKVIPAFIVNCYHYSWALAGAAFFGFPSKKIKVIGVTGTNGKTTTVDLISRILEEAGYKTALLSSIKFKIGPKEEENRLRMTMPGRAMIQKFLRRAVKNDCQYAVIEVSSEGILQHRHQFIDFRAALLTNLSPEHIESHGSFENYREAKGRFFKAVKNTHILNLDDENVGYFLKFKAEKKFGYKIIREQLSENSSRTVRELFSDSPDNYQDPISIIKAEGIRVLPSGIRFFVKGIDFNLKLLGGFNAYNALAAICLALSQGISLETCQKALKRAERVPGRMEMVISKPSAVFVDYAFTPNALKQVYQTIRNNWVTKKMICVLGAAGGGRDKWKRPVLGEMAASFCDRVIVTNEDPYDENPMEIINQVASGAKGKAEKVLDRRQAIRQALEEAEEGDGVVITGKGCEPSIYLAEGKKMSWDDRKVVREEFQKIRDKG